MSELPVGWVTTTLGALGEWSSGGTPSRKQSGYFGGAIPWVKTGDLSHDFIDSVDEGITEDGLKNSSAKLFPSGSLLVAMYGATIGETGILKFDAATNQACAALLARGETSSVIPFVWKYLIAKQAELRAIGQGGAQPNISQTILKDYQICIPPIAEQRRIVAKIDSLSGKSKRARDHLAHVPKLVEQYKAAILRSAFRGDLTATFREDAAAPVSAPATLPNEFSGCEIPASWEVTRFCDAVDNHDGKRVPLKKADRAKRPGAYPYYGASGVIDSIDDYLFDGRFLLIAEDGANLLSRSTPIAFTAEGQFWVNNHAHVVCARTEFDHDFIRHYLENLDLSPFVTGSAQPKLTQKALNEIFILKPPIREQRKIVCRIESAFAWIDRLLAEATSARKLMDHLDQAVLSKAFRGELVPQDSNDEPASVLLARISAEGAGGSRNGRRSAG